MRIKTVFLQSNILPLLAAIALNITANKVGDNVYSDAFAKELIRSQKVEKVVNLEKFFKKNNSPLVNHSETFVEVAEKYGLDYRLLPAISCMESSCGKYLIEGSYNPFGWGIYGTNAIYFEDYDEAIETVGKGLKDNYLSRGFDTPQKIAPVYTPPNHVNWLNGVTYFMNSIENISDNNDSNDA